MVKIRKGRLEDIKEMQQLFVDTISTICKNDYSKEEIKAWTSTIQNKNRWIEIISKQFTIIGLKENKIIGFCSLENSNHLDFLYIHKDYQRQGIAKYLYLEIEKEANRLNQIIITSDVSITAIPFFKKMGWQKISKQENIVKNNTLINYKMKKCLIKE